LPDYTWTDLGFKGPTQLVMVGAILRGFDFLDRFPHGVGFSPAEVFGEIFLASRLGRTARQSRADAAG